LEDADAVEARLDADPRASPHDRQHVCGLGSSLEDDLPAVARHVEVAHGDVGTEAGQIPLGTRLLMRPSRNTEHVLRKAATDALLENERALDADLKFGDIRKSVSAVYPAIMHSRDLDAGAWSCG
jgi:hypothetical protein